MIIINVRFVNSALVPCKVPFLDSDFQTLGQQKAHRGRLWSFLFRFSLSAIHAEP